MVIQEKIEIDYYYCKYLPLIYYLFIYNIKFIYLIIVNIEAILRKKCLIESAITYLKN